jgi:hypothetical protein
VAKWNVRRPLKSKFNLARGKMMKIEPECILRGPIFHVLLVKVRFWSQIITHQNIHTIRNFR